ncbi:zinc metallopeptidase [Paenibacillus athensensis]|uniref:Peptidase n=1 Tax=Paenibacillus athensensis TaxID=1967502 RepID=A0A4Y8Q9K8_9BACL|nr:zinc metallopeptidase [Paenibacillus athensensis]MCD1259074.1 zinc metallopeptidase [Paenibacillus athensensis]
MFYFHPVDFLILIAFGVSLWASFRVRGTFNRWSEVPAASRMTGAQAARRLLDSNGLYDVRIESVPGALSDHYDPVSRTVRLSEPVFGQSSIAAIAVACHEVGHAIQHKMRYPMLVARHYMFPVVNFASGVAPLLLIAGFVFQQFSWLLLLGILFFSAAVAFQLVTLPVEFNASARARTAMVQAGFISSQEEHGVAKVLNAAALTYVAAALISVLQLLKYVLIFNGRSND